MKLACSSTAFDERIRSGDLTQLEWVDLCAHELAADGAVFDVRHFPRTDTDYLAQLKKMAADTGLTVAAVRDDAFFSAGTAAMEQSAGIAIALGAPLLCAPLPGETQMPWGDVQAQLGHACSLAKRRNVTLAVRNAPKTFAASTHDMKRVVKEADSAWLRFGPDLQAFEAADDRAAIVSKAVILFTAGDPDDGAVRLLEGFGGFLVVDAAAGSASTGQKNSALRAWRKTLLEMADRT